MTLPGLGQQDPPQIRVVLVLDADQVVGFALVPDGGVNAPAALRLTGSSFGVGTTTDSSCVGSSYFLRW